MAFDRATRLQNAGAEALGALVLASGLIGRLLAMDGAAGALRAVAARTAIHFADDLRIAGGCTVVIAVEVVVSADVAGLLGAFALGVIGLEHGGLNDLAAGGVDRVRDVGVQLDAAVGVAGGAVLVELA